MHIVYTCKYVYMYIVYTFICIVVRPARLLSEVFALA